MVAAPWHRLAEDGAKAATATVGVVVTTRVVVAGPLQPAAVAVMIVVPLQPAAYVTAPVAGTILLPLKAAVVASKLYVIPVELLAVVVVVTVAAPWQRVAVEGENGLMVTDGVTVTTARLVVAVVHPKPGEGVNTQ